MNGTLLLAPNCVTLLGQLWPEGAPPFAVNLACFRLSAGKKG